MAIDIPSLFSDIIESPEQRRTRMLTEGTLLGRELTSGLRGYAQTQAPLVAAIAQRLPQQREDIRRGVGGMLGLDVRTQSEKVQDILRQGDTSTPEGMTRLARALQDVAPAQAIQLRQEAAAQTAAAKAAAATERLTNLRIQNELADAAARRAAEEAERAEQSRLLEEQQSGRTALRSYVAQKIGTQTPQDASQVQMYWNLIDSGRFDTGESIKELSELIAPEDRIEKWGNTAYNVTTGEWLIPPSTDPQTGKILELSPKDYDAASIGRYEFEVGKIQRDPTLSEDEKREQIKDAANIALKLIPEEKWVEITWDTKTGPRYISVPESSDKIEAKEKNLREFNNRNDIANRQATIGLDRIDAIRTIFNDAVANDQDVTGGIVNIIQTKIPGTTEYGIQVEKETLLAVLGLTALNEARAGSAVGASGFGALSNNELLLLQRSIANLGEGGLTEEQFIANLNYIESTLRTLQGKTATQYDYDQYVGLAPKPVYEGDL